MTVRKKRELVKLSLGRNLNLIVIMWLTHKFLRLHRITALFGISIKAIMLKAKCSNKKLNWSLMQ